MKKKPVLIMAVIVIFAVLAFSAGELIGAFPWQYISEDKINSFVKDSSYAFTYELPDAGDKVEWNSILTDHIANEIAAASYAARNGFSLETQGDAYIISDDVLNNEKTAMFQTLEHQAFEDSPLLTSTENGYLLHLKEVHTSGFSYEIVDMFQGLKGSEPTYVTVLYTLNGQRCKLEYTLAEDKTSPYTFKVVDLELCDAQ